MPNPQISDVHVNRPLTMLSVAFMQSATEFIADRVFPTVPVSKRSDSYFRYDRGDWNRVQAEERAPGAESAGGGWRVTTDTYTAKRYAFHQDVDDPTRANTDDPLSPDQDATQFVTQQLMLKREKLFVDQHFVASTWTGSTTGGDITPAVLWDDPASTPIEDIRAQITSIARKTGFRPNKLALGPEVWDALADHPDLLDRIKYTERGIVGRDLLAALLELDEVLVPRAVENTAAELATEASQFFWGKNALLVHAAPSPGLRVPSAGYNFAWTGLLGAGAFGNRIKRFRLERNESDRVEGEMAFDLKLVAAELGAFFASVVS